MKRKILFFILLFIFVINISSLATMAYYRYCRHDNKVSLIDSEKCANIHQLLELTSVQNSQVKEKIHILEKKITPIKSKIKENQVLLISLLKEDKPDADKIDEVLNSIGSQQKEIQKMVIENILEWKKVLNPEQEDKFLEIIFQKLTGSKTCETDCK